jgi:voltage-dependent calcium channel
MIIIQLVFLTVDSAPSVFKDPRSKAWGTSAFDYALLVLFSFYT